MVEVVVPGDRIVFGARFSLSFQRTLRIPDDGREYPLPPGLGRFPIHCIDDFKDHVPESWRNDGGVFIPMYQREALWLAFDAADWKPNAVKIGIGRINAVSGEQWDEELRAAPQDYIVCPPQLWLDGINAGEGYIRQFVAMPLGLGVTVEAQLTGAEEFGGIQVLVFEPKPGRFPDRPPRSKGEAGLPAAMSEMPSLEMGLGVGGRMQQRIHPDPHGVVQTYTEWGLPWFELYDEHLGDIPAAQQLERVKSVGEAYTGRPLERLNSCELGI